MEIEQAVARALEARELAEARLSSAGHDLARCRRLLWGLALAVAHVEATTGREHEQWLTYLGTVVQRLHDAPESGPGRPPRLSKLPLHMALRQAHEARNLTA